HHGGAALVPVPGAHLCRSAGRAHRSPGRSASDGLRVPAVGVLVVSEVPSARIPAPAARGFRRPARNDGSFCMTKVLVLGGSGMLGSMVADLLSRNGTFEVTATVRDAALAADFGARLPRAAWRVFRFDGDPPSPDLLDGHAWIVNAIGITKPLIRDDQPAEIERAIEVNARLPHLIGHRVRRSGARVLQIATDCVYSGRQGGYVESDAHDALDVYGKTKSLGESFQD